MKLWCPQNLNSVQTSWVPMLALYLTLTLCVSYTSSSPVYSIPCIDYPDCPQIPLERPRCGHLSSLFDPENPSCSNVECGLDICSDYWCYTACSTSCPCGVGYVCKRVEEPRSLPTPGQFFIDEYTVIHYKYTIGRKCVEMSQEDAEQLRLVRP